MNPFRVALAVARKDLRSEWRTRELVPALAQFIILALLIGNFGFQIDSRSAPSIAPGSLTLGWHTGPILARTPQPASAVSACRNAAQRAGWLGSMISGSKPSWR